MAAGKVSTHAIAMLRTVANCSPDPFAAMVPAMPEESTWVVDTGACIDALRHARCSKSVIERR